MSEPNHTVSINEHFKHVWRDLTTPARTYSGELKNKDLQGERQKLLIDLITSQRFDKPADALVDLIETIKNRSLGASKPPYPKELSLQTFAMLFQAVDAPVRHGAWATGGPLLATVDVPLFEKFSTQVVKEKLMAQKEVVVGLDQSPAHSKM